MSRKIGILTGGGDCPGLNAVISAVARGCEQAGFECIGFKKGFEGLIAEDGYIPLTLEAVRGIAHLGGTILQTTNKGHFAAKIGAGEKNQIDQELLDQVKKRVAELDIECLIVIGGDGTLSTGLQLQKNGINVVGVPKTIDNDLNSTDKTFGFSTGVEIIKEGLSRIHTTASSHDRIFFVETMGRNTGWLALYGGIAGGADMILIPEIPFSIDSIIEFIRERKSQDRNYAVIAVAEGAKVKGEDQVVQRQIGGRENLLGGIAVHLGMEIEKRVGDELEIRTVMLGHLQRGGSPIAEDIILGERFGYAAIEAARNKKYGHMVSLRGEKILTIPLEEAVDQLKMVEPNSELVRVAKSIGISFGETT